MKKNILILGLLLSTSFIASAQKDYNVVFDCTSKDSNDHKALIRWIDEIVKAEPTAQVEVVFFAQGTSMATQGRSTVATDITRLSANKNVAFKICSVAMANQHIEKSQLIPGVETVPDGIYEVISKQRQQWGYIKGKL